EAEGGAGGEAEAEVADEPLAEDERVAKARQPGEDVEGPGRPRDLDPLQPSEPTEGDRGVPRIAGLGLADERLPLDQPDPRGLLRGPEGVADDELLEVRHRPRQLGRGDRVADAPA